jgi:uncharacterized protein (DUF1810 family)
MAGPAGGGDSRDGDRFELERFTRGQEGIFERALGELKGGQKRSHWMWFIFPQIAGLGHSSTSRYYAIKSRGEADAYLNHPVLGPRLVECAEALLAIEGRTASAIMGYPDDLKLRSCMTLFERVAGPGSVFSRVLEKYYAGGRDERTLRLLGTT